MDLREEGGGVHDGDEGRARGRCFTGVEGAVGDDAGNGAADFGVAELSFGALVFTFCGFERALGGFEGGGVADLVHAGEVFGGGVVSSLGLDERGLRGVEVAAGDGSLGEELFAAVEDAL